MRKGVGASRSKAQLLPMYVTVRFSKSLANLHCFVLPKEVRGVEGLG